MTKFDPSLDLFFILKKSNKVKVLINCGIGMIKVSIDCVLHTVTKKLLSLTDDVFFIHCISVISFLC